MASLLRRVSSPRPRRRTNTGAKLPPPPVVIPVVPVTRGRVGITTAPPGTRRMGGDPTAESRIVRGPVPATRAQRGLTAPPPGSHRMGGDPTNERRFRRGVRQAGQVASRGATRTAGDTAADAVARAVTAATGQPQANRPARPSGAPSRPRANPSTPPSVSRARRAQGSPTGNATAPREQSAPARPKPNTVRARAAKSDAEFSSFDSSTRARALQDFLSTHAWARGADRDVVKDVVAFLLSKEKGRFGSQRYAGDGQSNPAADAVSRGVNLPGGPDAPPRRRRRR